MDRLFNPDSPVMSFLSRLADLIWLNFLTLLCSIPVVTAGAAFTALHYVSIKMVRNEEGYLTKSFFKSFKENFFQATAMWLLMLFLAVVAGADFYFISMMDSGAAFILRTGLCVVLFFFLCGAVYWFALLARFENSIKNTIKNACLIGILNFPKSICILIIYAVFLVLYGLFVIRILPLIFLLGISLPVYLASYLFSGIFKKLEPQDEEISQSV
ncbi:MAG: DUF624 domain-containing protein [Lachnospiraceae bacterium]|nr:DUF624 domain-containing protein [Lachnospiraceae bacterium]